MLVFSLWSSLIGQEAVTFLLVCVVFYQGPRGEAGASGAAGIRGVAGPQGPTGARGDDGRNGADVSVSRCSVCPLHSVSKLPEKTSTFKFAE